MLADRIRMARWGNKKLIDRTTPTVVVNQPYSTEGNGGRKLVRLDNGWLVAGVKNGGLVRFYISKNFGVSWSALCTVGNFTISTQDFAVTSNGSRLYVIRLSSNRDVYLYTFDALTVSGNVSGYELVDNENALGNCSLAINQQGTELHACWSSKNATYPNSFNIRYCKGTISGDGSVTWGGVEQVSTQNTTAISYISPCIIMNNVGNPVIIFQRFNSSGSNNHSIMRYYHNGSSWTISTVYNGVEHIQSSPSACVDKDGVIHVVWNRQTGTSSYQIAYSKSLDGGLVWSTPINIGSSRADSKPSIAVNSQETLNIQYSAGTNTICYESSNRGNSWTQLDNLYNMDNPSLLDDNTLDFEEPLGIYMTRANHPNPNLVVFRGKWYE